MFASRTQKICAPVLALAVLLAGAAYALNSYVNARIMAEYQAGMPAAAPETSEFSAFIQNPPRGITSFEKFTNDERQQLITIVKSDLDQGGLEFGYSVILRLLELNGDAVGYSNTVVEALAVSQGDELYKIHSDLVNGINGDLLTAGALRAFSECSEKLQRSEYLFGPQFGRLSDNYRWALGFNRLRCG